MSLDLKIDQVCPHLVYEELLHAESDRRTVRPKRPVSSGAIDVRMNGYPLLPTNKKFGFRLVRDPLANDRVIRFDRKLRSVDDFFEVSYFTSRSNCRRCGGLGLENDIRYNGKGVVVTVADAEKLLQDVRKMIFTVRGSNLFHPWYGAGLQEYIGRKAGNIDIIKGMIHSDIITSLDRMKSIQKQQAFVQPVTDGEALVGVTGITVEQDDADPTILRVGVTVINRAGDEDTMRDVFDLVRGGILFSGSLG